MVVRIFIAYVPRATAKGRGSWSLSRVADTATIGSARLLSPRQPQSNAVTRIRSRTEKSLVLLVALFLSLFVFVTTAGKVGAEEQMAPPMAQRCAMPSGVYPGTVTCPQPDRPSPAETTPVGSTTNGSPPVRPYPPPPTTLPPPPGPEPGQEQHALPNPGAEISGPGQEPTRQPQGPPHETASTPSERHGPVTSAVDPSHTKIRPEEVLPTPVSAPVPGSPAMEDSSVPRSATKPKPAPYVLRKAGPADARPSSAAGKVPASDKGVSSQSTPIRPAAKPAPSVANRATDQLPSRAQGSGGASSKVGQVSEPLVLQQAPLPSFAAEDHVAVHEALTQTIKAVSETLTRDLVELVKSWTANWLPFGEPTQSPLEGTVLDPLDPLFPAMPPLEDSSFFSSTGVGQVGPGGGFGLLLLGVLASVLILLRREGRLSWISGESPKPTSALLMPLERPG
jgi:hypothetical protein